MTGAADRAAEEALEMADRRDTPGSPGDGPLLANDLHGLDRKPSQAWATKMLTLTMPKNAETISIITTVLCAPNTANGRAGRTVKRNRRAATASHDDW
jgi:hypothetical protein